MIAPTPRAAVLIGLAAIVAFSIALTVPSRPALVLAPAILAFLAVVLDAARSPGGRRFSVAVTAPDEIHAGLSDVAVVVVERRGGLTPIWLRAVLETRAEIIAPPPAAWMRLGADEHAELHFPLRPVRRGIATLPRLWLSWTGPWGLARRRDRRRLDTRVAVVPNTRTARDIALSLGAREALSGLKPQALQGEGSELEALRAYVPGIDPRSIDWKRSARHMDLVCREFRADRNHPVILGVDCGRLMRERVDGAARLDHAIAASFALGWAALKSGDRVGYYAFDSRPRLSLAPSAGPSAFGLIRRAAASVEYSSEETNFTLALTDLAGRLNRRALVVVMTEFEDAIGAELMIENVGRLARRHRVLFVTTPDHGLTELAEARPDTPHDAVKAVVAGDLLRDRAEVFSRLRRLGAECVEAPPKAMAAVAVERYLNMKREDRL